MAKWVVKATVVLVKEVEAETKEEALRAANEMGDMEARFDWKPTKNGGYWTAKKED